MGLDLRLMVIDSHPHGMEKGPQGVLYSHTVLSMDRSSFFDAIERVEHRHGEPVKDLATWAGDKYERVSKTPYGSRLKWVPAKKLKRLAPDPQSKWNRSVWAFVAALGDETPIALWWH